MGGEPSAHRRRQARKEARKEAEERKERGSRGRGGGRGKGRAEEIQIKNVKKINPRKHGSPKPRARARLLALGPGGPRRCALAAPRSLPTGAGAAAAAGLGAEPAGRREGAGAAGEGGVCAREGRGERAACLFLASRGWYLPERGRGGRVGGTGVVAGVAIRVPPVFLLRLDSDRRHSPPQSRVGRVCHGDVGVQVKGTETRQLRAGAGVLLGGGGGVISRRLAPQHPSPQASGYPSPPGHSQSHLV